MRPARRLSKGPDDRRWPWRRARPHGRSQRTRIAGVSREHERAVAGVGRRSSMIVTGEAGQRHAMRTALLRAGARQRNHDPRSRSCEPHAGDVVDPLHRDLRRRMTSFGRPNSSAPSRAPQKRGSRRQINALRKVRHNRAKPCRDHVVNRLVAGSNPARGANSRAAYCVRARSVLAGLASLRFFATTRPRGGAAEGR
jgi:hypothetical protein